MQHDLSATIRRVMLDEPPTISPSLPAPRQSTSAAQPTAPIIGLSANWINYALAGAIGWGCGVMFMLLVLFIVFGR